MTRLLSAKMLHGRRFFLFSLVGFVNTLVDFAVFSAALFVGAVPAAANILAFAAANPFSYIVNGRVTFRSKSGGAPLSLAGYAKFCSAHLLSLVISTGIVFWLSPIWGAVSAKLAAVAITLFINFSASTVFVYGAGKKPPVERAESL